MVPVKTDTKLEFKEIKLGIVLIERSQDEHIRQIELRTGADIFF